MPSREESIRAATREFFAYYPDYAFCLTLAENVAEGVKAHSQAIGHLALKAARADENRESIEAKLNRRSVMIDGRRVLIRDLSLQQILRQDDNVLREIAEFYFKHPFAHGRTKQSSLLPGWVRTLALRAIVGHAKERGIKLHYTSYFHLLTLL